MKVYVLLEYYYEHSEVKGILASKEKAKEWLNKQNSYLEASDVNFITTHYEIKEMTLDKIKEG